MGIVHLWSDYEVRDSSDLPRISLARSTWANQPWTERPVKDTSLPRIFKERNRGLPYLKDLFDAGCAGLKDDDIVIYSNADIGFTPDACVRTVFALQTNHAGYAYRRDFGTITDVPDLNQTPGESYPGTDVFFFRAVWWRSCRSFMPDMLIAREAWDPCMRILMEETNSNKPLALDGICWHQRHGGSSHWEHSSNRYTLPGQIYNLAMARVFMKAHGYNPSTFGVR